MLKPTIDMRVAAYNNGKRLVGTVYDFDKDWDEQLQKSFLRITVRTEGGDLLDLHHSQVRQLYARARPQWWIAFYAGNGPSGSPDGPRGCFFKSREDAERWRILQGESQPGVPVVARIGSVRESGLLPQNKAWGRTADWIKPKATKPPAMSNAPVN